MPFAAKSLVFILAAKTLMFSVLAAQYDPMEEPAPFIFAAVLALATASVKGRRAWWFPLVVELFALAGCIVSIANWKSGGSSKHTLMMMAAALAMITFVGLVLVLRRSTRDWYKSRSAQ